MDMKQNLGWCHRCVCLKVFKLWVQTVDRLKTASTQHSRRAN